MKRVFLLNFAAIIATLTVIAITIIMVPDPLWSAVTIITAIGFATAVGFVFYIPRIFYQNQQGTDAQRIAAIGPFGIICILLLLTMGASFILAIVGNKTLGLAMLVFGVGAFLVASLMLKAALRVIGEISNTWSKLSHHIDWQRQVTVLMSCSTSKESLKILHSLSEKLRYSANDIQVDSPFDKSIEQTLCDLTDQLKSNSNADLVVNIGEMNKLLARRDVFMRAARGKA